LVSNFARFLSYLIAALQTLDPSIRRPALALLRTPQSPPLERVLVLLTNDLVSRSTADFALVLDDYHVITAGAIHQALTFLVEHLPPQFAASIVAELLHIPWVSVILTPKGITLTKGAG